MTTTQPRTSPHARQVAGFELTLTILGAVCSAVVTGVLAAENVSTTGKLIGMALGAALPPLVAAVGPGHPLRVAVAVLLTVVAVVISYSGWQIFATVTDTKPIVPSPGQLVNPDPDPDPPDPDNALIERAGDLGIKVVPRSITCDADDGCGPVTVTSVGTAPLRITSLEFEGDAGSYLTATGCENAVLATGEACTITLVFSPENASESVTTQLVIHQNLPEVPTLVPLEAEGVLTVSPNLALGQAACDRSGLFPDPDGGVVSGELSIEAPLSATGLADVSSVQAAVYVDGTQQWIVDADVNGGAVLLREFYVGQMPQEVRVQVDPGNVVQESNEDDNVVSCSF